MSRFSRRALRITLAVAAVSIAVTPAVAETWDSGGADSNWGTALNWDTNLVPANNGAANIFFGTGAKLTPNVNVPWDVASVTFNSGAAAFSLGGSILTIRSGGITNNSANTQTIADPITLGAAQTWTAASGPLVLGGNVVNGGNLLTVAGNSNTSIIAVMSGVGGLTKSGSGTLTLGNGVGDTFANTYTGLTTAGGGTLILDKAAGTVAIVGNVVSNGGTITANRAGQFSTSSNVTLSGGVVNFGASNTIGSLTALFGGYSAAGGTLNLTSTATNALTLGNGLTLGGFNFIGASGGGINLPNGSIFSTTLANVGLGGVNRTINVAEGGATDDLGITGVVSNGGIIKTGPGTLGLTGINTYAGGTTINQGSVRITSDASLGNAGSAVTLNGGMLWISGPVTSSRPIVVSATGGTFFSSFDTTWSGVMSGSGPVLKTGQKVVLGAGAADTTANTYNGVMTVDSGGLFLDKAAGTVAVAGNLIINTDGWVTASRAGQFGNGINITVNGGELTYGTSNTFGSLTFYGGTLGFTAVGVFLESGTTPLTLGGGVSLSTNVTFGAPTSGGVALVGNNTSSATMSGNMNLGLMNRVFDVADNASGDDLIVSGQLSNGGLTKTGLGTLLLSGNNTVSNNFNGITINAGVVRVSADSALGAAGTVTIGDGAAFETSSSFTLSHAISSNGGEIRVDAGTTLTAAAGVSSPTWSKTGGGTLLLPTANSMSGLSRIHDGTLAIGNDAALGGSTLEMGGGAVRADGAARTLSNPLVLDGLVNSTFDGPFDLTFNGAISAMDGLPTITVNNTTRFAGPVGPVSGAFA
ncbi:MAG TPA: autotransporter-associated beta strand repeat-containing protein, partial [Tepidisphaeraceae bacterium]|nr:autotransporter-associated beta strand repeat-containing protein [Tepidisphaeraceae bacterium]